MLFSRFPGAVLTVLSLAFLPGTAIAGPDTLFTGNGSAAALSLTTAGNVVNRYAGLTAAVAAGDAALTTGTPYGSTTYSFAAGRLVLLHQTAAPSGSTIPTSGSSAAVNATTLGVGQWEFARVASVSGSTITLTGPLVNSYAATGAQVVSVPEFTNVTLSTAGRIIATAWNGQAGGIIAFLANGTVTMASGSQINAAGAGFRGGGIVSDNSGTTGATGLDESAPTGAQKGEGFFTSRFGSSQTGRGNVGNGAGGGVALRSGGGGGGHIGAGGIGGYSDGIDGSRNVGGLGGTSVTTTSDRLLLGAGGGAGHDADGTGIAGGRGGGIVLIRANAITVSSGTATISAAGAAGGTASTDAGSGGGAGGSIYLKTVGALAPNRLVGGGTGGSTSASQAGPGGGGSGGAVILQAGTLSGSNTVAGGNAGTQADPGSGTYGAATGGSGSATTLYGAYARPATPSITSTGGGAAAGSSSTISGTATANRTVQLYRNGLRLGTTTSNGSGNWSYTASLPNGSNDIRATVVVNNEESSFSNSVNYALALQLLEADARAEAAGIRLQWQAAFDGMPARCGVERLDGDGRTWQLLAEKSAPVGTGAGSRSEWLDAAPLAGINRYRIVLTATGGDAIYSRVLSAAWQPGTPAALRLVPNPGSAGSGFTVLTGGPAIRLVQVSDAAGRVVLTRDGNGSSSLAVSAAALPAGLYQVSVRTDAGVQVTSWMCR